MSKKTKKVFLLISSKGGVGKTTVSRGIVDFARRNDIPLAAFDSDVKVRQLEQLYGTRDELGNISKEQDPEKGIFSFDIRDSKESNLLLDVIEGGHENMLFDLPGGVLDTLMTFVDSGESIIDTYLEHGYEPHVVVVISHMKGSIMSIRQAFDFFGSKAKYTVIKNLSFLNIKEINDEGLTVFDLFDTDAINKDMTEKQFCVKNNMKVSLLPGIEPNTYAKIDSINKPFYELLDNSKRFEGVGITDRSRISKFIKDFDKHVAKPLFGVE